MFDKAVELLKNGDVVVAPTDTVYGLFADATSDDAVKKIYKVKGRPASNPLILHVNSVDMFKEYAYVSDDIINVVDMCWNTLKLPVTFVTRIKDNVNISQIATAGLSTAAFRCPNHEIALGLITAVGHPLAAPSANTSTSVSPTSPEMVKNDLMDKVPLILDGGQCKFGLESTILDVTQIPFLILRHGSVPIELLKKHIKQAVSVNKSSISIIAPGMMRKHYAPSIPLRINADVPKKGEAFIAFGKTPIHYNANLSVSANLYEAAHNLFSTIKSFDKPEKYTGIAIMPIPSIGIGAAINDRLERASTKNRVLLVILDGFGISEKRDGNAARAATYINNLPRTEIDASGRAVGLPDGQFGNSEVGHMTLGAGRVIKQKLPLIDDSIADGSFDKNETMNNFLENVNLCHVMCLFSDGRVHSSIDHLFHCLAILREKGIKIAAHLFLDGRDVAYNCAADTLANALKNGQIKGEEIATIHGRFYAMDRDNHTERTQMSYDAIVNAKAEYANVTDHVAMIKHFYAQNIFDENITPFVSDWYKGAKAHDSFWMLNYRADRAKQILKMILNDNYKLLNVVELDKDIDEKANIMFKQPPVNNCLGEIISNNNLRQLRIAETEKYAHVTYFFNAGKEEPYKLEDRILIDSPRVANYAETPDMSASLLTESVLKHMQEKVYDFIVVNYANADMVGHTGNYSATVEAIEMLDKHISSLATTAEKSGYKIIITADHGNAEKMINNDGSPCKTHTCNKVPLIKLMCEFNTNVKSIAGVAHAVLEELGLPTPADMVIE